jgi:hypothetical protein
MAYVSGSMDTCGHSEKQTTLFAGIGDEPVLKIVPEPS